QINSTGSIIILGNSTGNGTTNETLLFYDTYLSSNIFFTCGPVTNTTGNIYSCVFDTTGKSVGTYNVTMIGSKDFHNNGTDTETNAFEIKSTPLLKAADVDVRDDGWGVSRTFSVNVSDNTGDTVTVRLWENLGSGFVEVGNQTCVSCDNTVLTFDTIYTCAQKGPGKKFKFNATDTEGNSDETTILQSGDYVGDDDTFIIDEDNVRVDFISGNEINATLNTAAKFELRIFNLIEKGNY
ncbi:MAG: hypothetical protein IIB08_01775, partial [Bacteroidetes bacterium]|nr:hypothetical protein [Bacteroidota bacterium]